MEISIVKILQIIVLQAAFLGFYHGYLSRKVDFQFARVYLLITLVGSILIPFTSLSIASDLGIANPYILPEIGFTGIDQLSKNVSSLPFDQLVFGLYAIIATAIAIKLFSALVRITHVILSDPKTKIATSFFGPFLFWNPHPDLSQE
jgi:bla regulator protein BlaR1